MDERTGDDEKINLQSRSFWKRNVRSEPTSLADGITVDPEVVLVLLANA